MITIDTYDLKQVEKIIIKACLKAYPSYNTDKLAEILNIGRNTLYVRLREMSKDGEDINYKKHKRKNTNKALSVKASTKTEVPQKRLKLQSLDEESRMISKKEKEFQRKEKEYNKKKAALLRQRENLPYREPVYTGSRSSFLHPIDID